MAAERYLEGYRIMGLDPKLCDNNHWDGLHSYYAFEALETREQWSMTDYWLGEANYSGEMDDFTYRRKAKENDAAYEDEIAHLKERMWADMGSPE